MGSPEAGEHFTNACRHVEMAQILHSHDFPEGTVFHCVQAVEALCCSLVREAGDKPPTDHKKIPDAALRGLEKLGRPLNDDVNLRLSGLTGSIKSSNLRNAALYVESRGLEARLPCHRPDIVDTSQKMLPDVCNLRDSIRALLD